MIDIYTICIPIHEMQYVWALHAGAGRKRQHEPPQKSKKQRLEQDFKDLPLSSDGRQRVKCCECGSQGLLKCMLQLTRRCGQYVYHGEGCDTGQS
jgi:hypothetical protein